MVVLFSCKELILVNMTYPLIADQSPRISDVIIVPGGGNFQRAKKGLELYKKGFGKIFILTGDIKGWPGIDDGTWADLSKKYLLKNNIDEKNILLLHSTSTREDIIRSFELMRSKGLKSCVIVSTLFHTGRIYRIAKKESKDINFSVVASTNYEYNKYNWWKTEKGLLFYFNEILKNIYYLYKGYV